MKEDRATNREKLQRLLRELFQFDAADLDFGIYRILNQRRERIEQFIEQDLLDAVQEGLATLGSAEAEEIQRRMDDIRRQLGANAFDDEGAVLEKHRDLDIAREYMSLRQELQQLEVAAETEARVFNDLHRFFARYYDQGDFLTERRYSSRDPKYAIPYNGEEVLLHWANRDQYYVKTSEQFAEYRFRADGTTVWFKLEGAQEPTDNVKSQDRYFVLQGGDPLEVEEEGDLLVVHMEYRPLTEAEHDHYLKRYNQQQSKSAQRKTLDRSVLVDALEIEILEGLESAELKAALARPRGGNSSSDRSELGYHLNRFTARNTMDYFIHKDLGGFLRRELDHYLKAEILQVRDVLGDPAGEALQAALRRARVVRDIAEKVIAFLAQIEDFQKRLFEKKKFVVQTDYCITLDRVPEEFYEEILANQDQLEQWMSLYKFDKWTGDLTWEGKITEEFLVSYPFMMVDTALFDSAFKYRIISRFNDLDGSTGATLIKSDNLQALQLLHEKYQEQVKCVYIDPPYNTGNDAFLYKDKYRHSSWLAMIKDRLERSRSLLRNDGAIFTSIDDNEQTHLREASDEVFGPSNFVANVIWQKNFAPKNTARYFSEDHDYILVYARNKEQWTPNLLPRTEEADARYSNPDDDPRGPWASDNLLARNYYSKGQYEVVSPSGERYKNPTGTYWRVSKERFEELDEDNRIWWGSGEGNMPRLKRFLSEVKQGMVPQTIWPYEEVGHTQEAKKELLATVDFATTEDVLNTVKPTRLIRQVLTVSTSPEAEPMVIDFFAGSGTTGHAVINLNREDASMRRFILIEMGDYFSTMMLPRIQRVVFSSNWDGTVPQHNDGVSFMFKYHRLESYEDALNNIELTTPKEDQATFLYDETDDYLLGYMLDFESKESATLLREEAFDRPFDYRLLIQKGMESPQPTKVDLVETFHYLIGMHVRRLEYLEHQDRDYAISRGEVRTDQGIEQVVVVWRRTIDPELDLEAEAEWFSSEVVTEPVDRVYVNSESHIRGGEPLERVFRERMEGKSHRG